MDTTAAGDIWDNTLGITGNLQLLQLVMIACSTHFHHDGWFSCNSFMHQGQLLTSHYIIWYLLITGVEGLTLNYGSGDSGVTGSEVKVLLCMLLTQWVFHSRLLSN